RRPAPLGAARAGAAGRRRVAQDERAAGGDRCVGQAHRRARPVSAPASPSPLELTASDGRTLAGLVLEAPGARGALAINGATGFRREFYLKFAVYCARRGYLPGLRLPRHRRLGPPAARRGGSAHERL